MYMYIYMYICVCIYMLAGRLSKTYVADVQFAMNE